MASMHTRHHDRPPPPPAASITSYEVALQYLNAHINLERVRRVLDPESTFKLDRTRRLLEALGNPHKHLRCIHVGGTKGKGSTVAMLSAALRSADYTTGCYTSPHLVDVRERIQVDDQDISRIEFTDAMRTVAQAIDRVNGEQSPGIESPHFFEILTALAFLHFAHRAVDIAIIEVGLGGRLDSTNVMTPEICAMTHISLDHTRILGNSLEAIAGEKAGIFKPDIPVVSVPQEPEVERVFRAKAEAVGTTVLFLDKDFDFCDRLESSPELGPHTRIGLGFKTVSFDHVIIPLPGRHQAVNGGLALAVGAMLYDRGHAIDFSCFTDGLAHTSIRGRMELVSTSPAIMIDGAHNTASIAALFDAIRAHVQCDSVIVIFGCAQDKDIRGMLTLLSRRADKAIFTRASANPWAADPDELEDCYTELGGRMCQVVPNLHEALEIAARPLTPDDLILVTGSFVLAGEARKLLVKDAAHSDEAFGERASSSSLAAEIGVRRGLSPVARLAQFRRR